MSQKVTLSGKSSLAIAVGAASRGESARSSRYIWPVLIARKATDSTQVLT
jgi:hypothetical protein